MLPLKIILLHFRFNPAKKRRLEDGDSSEGTIINLQTGNDTHIEHNECCTILSCTIHE